MGIDYRQRGYREASEINGKLKQRALESQLKIEEEERIQSLKEEIERKRKCKHCGKEYHWNGEFRKRYQFCSEECMIEWDRERREEKITRYQRRKEEKNLIMILRSKNQGIRKDGNEP